LFTLNGNLLYKYLTHLQHNMADDKTKKNFVPKADRRMAPLL